jgi:ubiquinone/menaquinone biosynthesis C-methylase UbiE
MKTDFQAFFSRQLARPSGWFGRLVTARWLERANVGMNALTLAELALGAEDRLLEIGFGSGQLLERAWRAHAPALVAGIDISQEMVTHATRRLRRHAASHDVRLEHGSVEAIPFADGEFTRVCSVNTLYFWPDPQRALAECRRVLCRGGRLVLCFNDRDEMLRWPGHVYGFTLYATRDVEAMLAAAGFATLRTASATDPRQGLFHCISAGAI